MGKRFRPPMFIKKMPENQTFLLKQDKRAALIDDVRKNLKPASKELTVCTSPLKPSCDILPYERKQQSAAEKNSLKLCQPAKVSCASKHCSPLKVALTNSPKSRIQGTHLPKWKRSSLPPTTMKRRFKAPRVVLPHKLEAAKKSSREEEKVVVKYYRVFFCKRSNKKHKSYADGILIVKGAVYSLKNEDGKKVGRSQTLGKMAKLGEGSDFYFGNYEVEVQDSLPAIEYESGRCFINSIPVTNLVKPTGDDSSVKRRRLLKGLPKHIKQMREAACNNMNPRNNPHAGRALVLNASRLGPNYTPKHDKVAVVVDGFIGDFLRPHQREGVLYMYEKVMGISNCTFTGVILADEMGLGKTLQAIALLWTLLKDGGQGRPTIKKAMIVTPSSLVRNWKREIKKWLGFERLSPLILKSVKKCEQTSCIHTFVNSYRFPVLIVSYEMFRKHYEAIRRAKLGLVLCDEGHRLKNSAGNATINALRDVGTGKRILLTGTPVQNRLSELYAMCDWVNPGVLGDLASFNEVYALPIQRGRDNAACPAVKRLGDSRSSELARKVESFILRRTAEINQKYLPPKKVYVCFVTPTETQIEIYKKLLRTKLVRRTMGGRTDSATQLSAILWLRKLSNSPRLLSKNLRSLELSESVKLLPQNYSESPQHVSSGKLKMLLRILTCARARGNDKFVVVSNFTSTLDIIQEQLVCHGFAHLRLDGKTPAEKRMEHVDKFNNPDCTGCVFLLSSKAGGVGLNLIGANRLVMFDPDWNPATDEQAMARIWREGQKKTCFIYRLITIGGIEEKIFQRQVHKLEVADSVVAKQHGARHFKTEEIKKLFELELNSEFCETYDLLKENLSSWIVCKPQDSCEDDVLDEVRLPSDGSRSQMPMVFYRDTSTKKRNETIKSKQQDSSTDSELVHLKAGGTNCSGRDNSRQEKPSLCKDLSDEEECMYNF